MGNGKGVLVHRIHGGGIGKIRGFWRGKWGEFWLMCFALDFSMDLISSGCFTGDFQRFLRIS